MSHLKIACLGRGGVWCVTTSVSKCIPPQSSAKSHPVLCVQFRIPLCTVISISSKNYGVKCIELNDGIHFSVSDKGLFADVFQFLQSSDAQNISCPLSCEILQFATVCCI